jgi:hypothetical protein
VHQRRVEAQPLGGEGQAAHVVAGRLELFRDEPALCRRFVGVGGRVQETFRHAVQAGELFVADERNVLDDRMRPGCGARPENAHAADRSRHAGGAEIGGRILVGVDV